MDLTTVLGSMCALSAHHTERASPTQLTNSSVITIYQDVLEIHGVAFMRSILEICSVDGMIGGNTAVVLKFLFPMILQNLSCL